MTYVSLLRSFPDFRRLWAGQVVSEIGDWLNNIAVLALTLELAGAGREGLAIAIYAVSRHLPLFLFGPVAGVVADRFDRRRIMICADVARALLALLFLIADRWHNLTLLYATGALLFSVSAFFNAAKRASIPNLVSGRDALLSANSLSASTTAATIAIGSACGGIIGALVDRHIVFILNTATFLVSAEMIRRIVARTQSDIRNELNDEAKSGVDEPARAARSDRLQRADGMRRFDPRAAGKIIASMPTRIYADFRDGLRFVRRDKMLTAVFIVAAGWGLGNGAARAVYSIFGAHLGEAWANGAIANPKDFGISVLFVAMGVGGVLGAPLARRFNTGASERKLGAQMTRSMIFDGAALAVFALMPGLWSAAFVLVVREMNFAVWWTAQQTMIMHHTDDQFGGRVFAAYETLTTLMMVGAMLVSGVAADKFGVSPVAVVGGVVVLLSGTLWFALIRRRA